MTSGYLKKLIISVRTTLMTTHVTIGKKKDPPSVFRKISPGNLPRGKRLNRG